MKITVISDTHGQHKQLGVMSGDVLIHCGDMFNLFEPSGYDVDMMDHWFGKQKFDLILCVGGNHDNNLQDRYEVEGNPFNNAVFLCDESYEYKGIKFYGAPWVPELYQQAFFKENEELEEAWSKIPNDTDVLITHTPRKGVLDKSSRGASYGCPYLSKALERVKPRFHCFGHVHNSAGSLTKNGTTYINAAMAGRKHELVRGGFQFEI